jgi:hypothetical protein
MEQLQRRVPAMTLRSKCLATAAMIAAAAGVACRTSRSAGAGLSYGFIVIGSRAAQQYQLAHGDTVAEVPVERVPPQVTSAADREARKLKFDPLCNRYFFTGDAYLTLYRSQCAPGIVVDDGAGMAFYRLNGEQAGESLTQLVGAFEALQPRDRNQIPKRQ